MRTFLESLRALLEGRRHERFDATERSVLHFQDPEPRFYMARQLARLGESRRAFEVLGDVLDCGYVCSRALDRDPWLEPLRGFVEFQRLRARAFALERERRELFVRAGGLRCGLQISAVGP
jgi:hypothetical protein